jgi:hypothetical protein
VSNVTPITPSIERTSSAVVVGHATVDGVTTGESGLEARVVLTTLAEDGSTEHPVFLTVDEARKLANRISFAALQLVGAIG